MSASKVGFIKWFRWDGTGYIVNPENPTETIYLDKSVLTKNEGKSLELKKGQKVKFKEIMLFGRKVATDVQPV